MQTLAPADGERCLTVYLFISTSITFHHTLLYVSEMDGLSSGASILAVVSLAIQLADSVKKIYEFWESVQDAPETIRQITSDLRLLAKVLSDTATCEERYGASETTAELLSSCKQTSRLRHQLF
jgi:hypothetical protein